MCDRVGIMNKGKIVALDTPSALKGMAKKNEVADIVVKNMSEAQVNASAGFGWRCRFSFRSAGFSSWADAPSGAFGERGLRCRLC